MSQSYGLFEGRASNRKRKARFRNEGTASDSLGFVSDSAEVVSDSIGVVSDSADVVSDSTGVVSDSAGVATVFASTGDAVSDTGCLFYCTMLKIKAFPRRPEAAHGVL